MFKPFNFHHLNAMPPKQAVVPPELQPHSQAFELQEPWGFSGEIW